MKNTLKTLRMELISHEDKCDNFCNENNLRKIRELYCLFFKNHARRNGVSNEEAEVGLDIFVCRQGLSDEFSEFVRERLVYNKPSCQSIEAYLACLGRMESVFRKSHV